MVLKGCQVLWQGNVQVINATDKSIRCKFSTMAPTLREAIIAALSKVLYAKGREIADMDQSQGTVAMLVQIQPARWQLSSTSTGESPQASSGEAMSQIEYANDILLSGLTCPPRRTGKETKGQRPG